MQDILQLLSHMAVVPVIRTPEKQLALRACTWLAEAGIGTAEITLTTPGALELISHLRSHTDLLVGAGTILSEADARAAIDAGAQYLVSPVCLSALADAAAGTALIMGAMTPSEVFAAHQAGAAAVKIFPASTCGGPSYIRALRAVFPKIIMAPTGGVTPANAADYLAAGAAFTGIGGNLVDVAALRAGDKSIIQGAARQALHTIETFRKKRKDADYEPG